MPLVNLMRCNSPYRLRYWNWPGSPDALKYWLSRCNSPYRLRYWNMSCLIFQIGSLFWVATVLTVYGIETCKKQKASGPKLCCNSIYRLQYWNWELGTPPTSSLCSGCNSTYRSRYWNLYKEADCSWTKSGLQQHLPFTVLKLYFLLTSFSIARL